MRSLACDLETYTPVNLTKSGVYPYTADPEFELLLFGYSIDSGDVVLVGEELGQGARDALGDRGAAQATEDYGASFLLTGRHLAVCWSIRARSKTPRASGSPGSPRSAERGTGTRSRSSRRA